MFTIISNTKLFIAAIVIVTIAFQSCDCVQNATGIVLDSHTKQPLDSVYVQNANKKYDNSYTDERDILS